MANDFTQIVNNNDSTPAAPTSDDVNVKWQADAPGSSTVPRNASAYVPKATATTPGCVPQPPNDGTKFLAGDATFKKVPLFNGVNAQTGTSYTFVQSDYGKLVTFSNASTIAGSLLNSGLTADWFCYVENRGAGSLTLTPGSGTIDGAGTLVLATEEGAIICYDGTNFFTMTGITGGGGGFTDPMTTEGDIIIYDSGAAVRLAIGSTSDVMTVVSGKPAWAPASGGGGSVGGVNAQTANYTADGTDNGKLIAFATASSAAPAFVQASTFDVNEVGNPTQAVTLAGVGAGNTVLAIIQVLASFGSITGISDGVNAYTLLSNSVNDNIRTYVYAFTYVSGGSKTITATYNGASALPYGIFAAVEASGLTGLMDQEADAAQGSTAISAGPITTTAANEFLLGIFGGHFDFVSATPGSGWTQAAFHDDSGLSAFIEYQTGITASAYTADGTLGAASAANGVIVSLFGATGGSFTLTLPASPPSSTWLIFVTNTGGGDVTVDPNGLTLNGGSSLVLGPGQRAVIATDGTNYFM